MKTVGLFILLVAAAAAVVVCRRRWVHRAARTCDAQIADNRFRYRPGMEDMDEGLRERTAQRRRDREHALARATRELERPRLHKVS